jgi:hypothetical protein
VSVAGEDVEDHRRAIDHRHAELLLEVALLARRELVVAGDEVGVGVGDQRLELIDLARPQVEVGMRLLAMLDELGGDRHARRAQQLLELGEVVALRHHADGHGALARARLRVARSAVA